MAPFALSVPGYRLGVHSQKQQPHDAAHQDSSTRSLSPHANSDGTDTPILFSASASARTSRLPSETINPLSHSPNTLRQLAVAGLSPEDELPSRFYPGFPNRPIPTSSRRQRRRGRSAASKRTSLLLGNDSGAETDATVTPRQQEGGGEGGSGSRRGGDNGKLDDVDDKHHSARMRHLNTMTAIMHRCLREGDMGRAKRALGLLLRTRDVDIRYDNLWAIGSEILMREGEREEKMVSALAKRPLSPTFLSSSSSESDDASGSGADDDSDVVNQGSRRGRKLGDAEEEEDEGGEGHPNPPQRWGSAANFAQVRHFFEILIQYNPYDAHRQQLPSAIDFWPALFGIEVYNLDAEFQTSLHNVYLEHGSPSLSSSRSRSRSPQDNGDYNMDLDDDDHEDGGRRRQQDGEEEDEDDEDRDRHAAIDDLRSETQRGALRLAARMDGVLENPPYNTHPELLRLRSHVGLFVADLFLPSRLMERYTRREGRQSQGQRYRRGERSLLHDAEQRLQKHAIHTDEQLALARRRAEQGRALVFFRRAVAAKGRVEDWITDALEEEEEDEEEEFDHEGLLRRRSGWGL
ncbi:hypothetical protein F4808DRAFT_356353 [Astrocystis sublimbata]|nr:hypothetical protein F4808DRAFT_356353 [Astrocystis sublimbata]